MSILPFDRLLCLLCAKSMWEVDTTNISKMCYFASLKLYFLWNRFTRSEKDVSFKWCLIHTEGSILQLTRNYPSCVRFKTVHCVVMLHSEIGSQSDSPSVISWDLLVKKQSHQLQLGLNNVSWRKVTRQCLQNIKK